MIVLRAVEWISSLPLRAFRWSRCLVRGLDRSWKQSLVNTLLGAFFTGVFTLAGVVFAWLLTAIKAPSLVEEQPDPEVAVTHLTTPETDANQQVADVLVPITATPPPSSSESSAPPVGELPQPTSHDNSPAQSSRVQPKATISASATKQKTNTQLGDSEVGSPSSSTPTTTPPSAKPPPAIQPHGNLEIDPELKDKIEKTKAVGKLAEVIKANGGMTASQAASTTHAQLSKLTASHDFDFPKCESINYLSKLVTEVPDPNQADANIAAACVTCRGIIGPEACSTYCNRPNGSDRCK